MEQHRVDWSGCAALAQSLGLPWEPDDEEKLGQYLALLLKWAKAVNLVGTSDPQRIVDELIADALPAVAALQPGDRVIDIGSGAGLPGLVLALLQPELHVMLMEPRQRRVAFLRAAVTDLGLADRVTVMRGRLDPGTSLPPHDVLVSRAVWSPEEWLLLAARVRGSNARVLVFVTGTLPVNPAVPLARSVPYALPHDPRRVLGVYADSEPGSCSYPTRNTPTP